MSYSSAIFPVTQSIFQAIDRADTTVNSLILASGDIIISRNAAFQVRYAPIF